MLADCIRVSTAYGALIDLLSDELTAAGVDRHNLHEVRRISPSETSGSGVETHGTILREPHCTRSKICASPDPAERAQTFGRPDQVY
jgi:hypothetical protein